MPGIDCRESRKNHGCYGRSTPLSLKPADAATLTAEDVVVHFGGLAAIADVSLAVGRHEVFGLIGPNGAGKTTLVNCLTGFQRPDRAAVSLLGARATPTGWTASSAFANGRCRPHLPGRAPVQVT